MTVCINKKFINYEILTVVSSIGPVDKVIYKPRFHAIIPARRDRR